MATDVQIMLEDLDAGVFLQKLSHAFSAVAGNVVDTGKTGEVSLKFSMSRIGNSHQVNIKHKLAFTMPTARGKASEEDTTETPMFVGSKGKLTLFPENQTQLFTKQGQPTDTSNKESQ